MKKVQKIFAINQRLEVKHDSSRVLGIPNFSTRSLNDPYESNLKSDVLPLVGISNFDQ